MAKTIFPSDIELAAQAIRDGELVAFPTETVYGLGADALNPAAVARIFEAKGRPGTSPLIVHVTSDREARALAAHWPEQAQLLANKFWPGPLTMIVSRTSAIPDIVTAGLDSVGLRVPANDIALSLIQAAGVPIAAPSANRFTELSPTRAEHVQQSLGDRIRFIIDGGPTTVGIESTVMSLIGPVPRLLRPGTISREELESVIGELQVHSAPSHRQAHESPGQHAAHYRPRTRLLIANPTELPEGHGAFLYLTSPGTSSVPIPMPADARAYAACFYDVLHEVDARHLPWIAVEPLPQAPQWDGLRDRLSRAARPLY